MIMNKNNNNNGISLYITTFHVALLPCTGRHGSQRIRAPRAEARRNARAQTTLARQSPSLHRHCTTKLCTPVQALGPSTASSGTAPKAAFVARCLSLLRIVLHFLLSSNP